MHVIRIGTQTFKAPSGWSEVTAADLLYLGQISSLSVQNYITVYYTLTKLYRIPRKLFFKLTAGQKIQLKHTIKWVFDKNTLQNWLIKSVKQGVFTLKGPQSQLADLTVEEFIHTEAAYERWLASEDNEHLNTLFAILFRKAAFWSGKRSLFDEDSLEAGIKQAEKVKYFVKRAVAINYAGIRNLIIDRHQWIWTKSEGGASTGPQAPTPWPIMVLNHCPGPFGTYAETIKAPVWLVLNDINSKQKPRNP